MPELSSGGIKPVLLRVVGAAVLFHVLLIYFPPSVVSFAVLILVSAAALFLDYRKLLPLALSLLFTTGALEVVVRLGASEALNPYYRPHEVLSRGPGETSYLPNESVAMAVPHGDLLAIAPDLPESLIEPRYEVFRTDSLGYRNDADYAGEPFVFVGDSYLVGTESTLTAELKSRHDIHAYNVSYSGTGPLIYAEKVQFVRTEFGSGRIAVFFFEGNDFEPMNPTEQAARDFVPRQAQRWLADYIRAVRGSSLWARTFYGLTSRSAHLLAVRNGPDDSSPVFVRVVGGQPMAFLRGYADVVRRTSFDDHSFIRSRLAEARPDLVVFIPDKFRIYGPLLDEQPEADLPHAQWDYLEAVTAELGVPSLDLTAELFERSRLLLESGLFTYWRDDTHWNRIGEQVAAEILATTLDHLGWLSDIVP